MKRFVLSCIALFVLVLTLSVVILVQQLHQDLVNLDKLTVQTTADLHGAAQNANAVLLQLGITADEVRRAATEERAHWLRTSHETALTMRAARQLIDRTDRKLNDGLLPDLQLQQDQVAAAATTALDSLGHSADLLAAQLSDPHLTAIAGNLDQASAGLELTSDHLAHTTADIEVEVHKLTRPASFAKRFGGAVLEFGAKIGSVLAGFLKL